MKYKVSVLMPVYNAAPYLREAIDSILSQTFADFEFLIINDGSTDTSEGIIKSYQDSRIRYLKNAQNLGLVNTLNLGLEAAQGEYIARMDADDISLPTRFARQVAYMDQHPQVGACGTAYRYFGEVNEIKWLPSDHREAFTLLSSTSCLGHPTSLIRRSILHRYQIRYEKEYEYAEDYALWVRIGQVSHLCSLPELLLLYRWHEHNKSKTDANALLARTQVRVLWHELMLGDPLEAGQKCYLAGEASDWKTYRTARRMLAAVLATPVGFLPLDKEQYGRSFVTDWELESIERFGMRGLLACLLQPGFHQWSRATALGLIAHYLRTW